MPTLTKNIVLSAALLAFPGCSSNVSPRLAEDSGSPVTTCTNGGSPTAPEAKAYIGLFGDNAVAVFDTARKMVAKTIAVTAPDGLVVTPDGSKVYVSSGDTGTVKVIDANADSLVGSIDVGSKPAGLAVTPDGRYVVASVSGANQAAIIDTSTDTVVKTFDVGLAHASCISQDGRYAYVGSQVTTAPAIVAVDISGQTSPNSFSVDKSPRMLACGDSSIYFTAVGRDAVEVLDLTSGALGSAIATGGSPHDIRPTRDSQFELVVSQTDGDLEFIDRAGATVVAKVPTGKLPHWIAVGRNGQQAYVTNEGDNDVVLVDLAARSVIETISVGNAPRKMALRACGS